jgi:acetyl esterase/lipase
MKRFIFSFLSIFFFTAVIVTAQSFKLKLWPDGAPNKNNPPGKEEFNIRYGTHRYWNVSEAELFVYLPEKGKNRQAAMVICPGGGYCDEAIELEGFMLAEYLNKIGVAGIVLKYRLPYGNPEIPTTDALHAIRFVRSKAAEWGLDPGKIGIAGGSAGGHLASTVGTHFDMGNKNSSDPIERVSSRPDFMLLLYPVVSFNVGWGHTGTGKNLISEENNREMIEKYSNELQVTKETPPTFLVLADDDQIVLPRNSVEFYLALKKNNIPAEMHIFQKGGHGFGMLKEGLPVDQWPELFANWLKGMKIID